MKKIIIWCEAGTGSTCLSRTFEACGVNLGDTSTYYHGNYEHNLLTSIIGANDMNASTLPELEARYQKVPGDDQVSKMRHILRSFMTKNWTACGLKVTTGLSQVGFFKSLYVFLDEWGDDTHFVSTVRHPLGSIMRLPANQRTDDRMENLVNGIRGLNYGKMGLALAGAHTILYPEGFDTGVVKRVVEKIGLEWTDKASGVYDSGRPTRVTEGAMKQFEEKYPDLGYSYRMLKECTCR